jgi:large-conductance mechanosensitive channel
MTYTDCVELIFKLVLIAFLVFVIVSDWSKWL